MLEVEFVGKDKELVDLFNSRVKKLSVNWEEQQYSPVRKTIKDHYLKEQNYTCYFCKQRIFVKNNRAWDIEHIISKSSHPEFMFEPRNLCVVCPDCNNEKRDKNVLRRKSIVKFPTKSKAYKIVHPHFDIYEDHLSVLVEGKLYQYKTPKGLFTIRTYGLDRFMKDSGRTKGIVPGSKVYRLMQSALTSSEDYESIARELCEELLLKYSPEIGARESVAAIENLRKGKSSA